MTGSAERLYSRQMHCRSEIRFGAVSSEMCRPRHIRALLHIALVEVLGTFLSTWRAHHPAGRLTEHCREGLRARRKQIGSVAHVIDRNIPIVIAFVRLSCA